MNNIAARVKEFNSVKGYFLSDKKALAYIKLNFETWDVSTLNGKVGVLGLKRLVPDYRYGDFLQSLVDSNIKQAVMDGDFNIFKMLVHDLSYLDEARFIVSTLLCGHRPDHFPIWDERKALINGWQLEKDKFSYQDLKLKINEFEASNGIIDLNYFFFNKLLWFCE